MRGNYHFIHSTWYANNVSYRDIDTAKQMRESLVMIARKLGFGNIHSPMTLAIQTVKEFLMRKSYFSRTTLRRCGIAMLRLSKT